MSRLTCLLAGQVSGRAGVGREAEDGLEAVELAIRTAVLELGGSLLGRPLAADGGHRGHRIDCGAGHQGEFVAYRDKTIATALGPVQLRRAWYHCPACGHGLAPRDDELGVAGTSLTPGLRKMIDRAGAAVPFAPAGRLLGDLAGVKVNAKAVQRAAEADGRTADTAITARAQAIRARTLVPLPPNPLPDILYVAIDGTGVPMTPDQTTGRAGKTDRPGGQSGTLPDDGRARTREVKLACVFTQTELDEDGYPVRDPGSSSYLASFAAAHEFGPLVAAEARRRGADHVRQVVVLATAHPGSGRSPASSYPPRPRSWTSTTPANTSTTWPPPSRSSSPTANSGWPTASTNSTPATSKRSSPPPPLPSTPWSASRPPTATTP